MAVGWLTKQKINYTITGSRPGPPTRQIFALKIYLGKLWIGRAGQFRSYIHCRFKSPGNTQGNCFATKQLGTVMPQKDSITIQGMDNSDSSDLRSGVECLHAYRLFRQLSALHQL